MSNEIDVTAYKEIVNVYRTATAEIAKWSKIRDELNSALKNAIGDAEIATVDGVPALRRQVVSSRRFDSKKFQDEFPELADKYLVSTESIRLTVIPVG